MNAPVEPPDGDSDDARLPDSKLLPVSRRLLMLVINYVPLLHVLSLVLVCAYPWTSWRWRLPTAAIVLYLVPPVLARVVLLIFPIREHRIRLGTAPYFTWWILLNLQVIFCRLPLLDEALRLVPSLYSTWLRLWGSRIGRLTYWAPGTRILDRPFLEIGDDVVFGAGVRLNPHVIARDENGDLELILAPVVIGDRAIIGGYCLLTAGTQIADDECTRACLQLPPFTTWRDGRRANDAQADSQEQARP